MDSVHVGTQLGVPIFLVAGDSMDARGVVRLLEKIQGMAQTADHVALKYAETMEREPRLSDAAKMKLAPLYAEHGLRVMKLYAALGLEICSSVQEELEDDQARAQLELFRANFDTLNQRAVASLSDWGAAAKLG